MLQSTWSAYLPIGLQTSQQAPKQAYLVVTGVLLCSDQRLPVCVDRPQAGLAFAGTALREAMDVVFISDGQYLRPLAVSLASFLAAHEGGGE